MTTLILWHKYIYIHLRIIHAFSDVVAHRTAICIISIEPDSDSVAYSLIKLRLKRYR